MRSIHSFLSGKNNLSTRQLSWKFNMENLITSRALSSHGQLYPGEQIRDPRITAKRTGCFYVVVKI